MSCLLYDLHLRYVTVITVHPLVIHMQIFSHKINIFINENNAHCTIYNIVHVTTSYYHSITYIKTVLLDRALSSYHMELL